MALEFSKTDDSGVLTLCEVSEGRLKLINSIVEMKDVFERVKEKPKADDKLKK